MKLKKQKINEDFENFEPQIEGKESRI